MKVSMKKLSNSIIHQGHLITNPGLMNQ